MNARMFIFILACSALFLSANSQRRMVAEWEPAFGTLIRWPLGIPGDLVKELAESDSIYVLVENYNQQLQATTTFQSYGVNMDHCRFILANTYSHWTRDWGPHYVFDENGDANIADPIFDGYPWVPGCNSRGNVKNLHTGKGYEEDDAVNAVLAETFGLPLISLPAYLTGGNVMTDGHGYAVSTRQMLDENAPVCDETCFMQAAEELLGIHQYFIAENPEIYGIQHIDCYAKFLDEERILVKSLPPGHPEYQCVEELATFLGNQTGCYGRKYEIIRIYCAPYNGTEVAAYTNSLILNKKVFVPLFNIAADEQALQVYEEAMPGYEVIGFDGSWYYYDALHCRTMGIFDPEMLVMWHRAPQKAQSNMPVSLVARIDDRSESGLAPGLLKLFWREEGNMFWNNVLLSPTAEPDSFIAQLPSFPGGTHLEYYFAATDSSGRHEKLPRTAPGGFYALEISDIVIGLVEHSSQFHVKVFPTLFSDDTHIEVCSFEGGVLRIEIINILGETIWQEESRIPAGEMMHRNLPMGGMPGGTYFTRLTLNNTFQIRKIIKTP